MTGEHERAVAHCRAAAAGTASVPERDYLVRKVAAACLRRVLI